jgi:glycosyltransferase involved in cell wall biosynthesis
MLAAMDCLVGLCDHEGFWRVGIEAGIAGVPLVSTRVGILREIAENRGVLWEEVPIRVSAEGVAEAVRRLRAAGGNPDRTASMRAVASEYSMERFGRAWKSLLGKLVKPSP